MKLLTQLSFSLMGSLFLCSHLYAAQGKHPVASRNRVDARIQLNVTFGAKTTEFLITQDHGGVRYSVRINQEKPIEKKSDRADLAYLLQKFKHLPPQLEASDRCAKQRVDVKVVGIPGQNHYESSACLDENTDTARELLEIANLLSYWVG